MPQFFAFNGLFIVSFFIAMDSHFLEKLFDCVARFASRRKGVNFPVVRGEMPVVFHYRTVWAFVFYVTGLFCELIIFYILLMASPEFKELVFLFTVPLFLHGLYLLFQTIRVTCMLFLSKVQKQDFGLSFESGSLLIRLTPFSPLILHQTDCVYVEETGPLALPHTRLGPGIHNPRYVILHLKNGRSLWISSGFVSNTRFLKRRLERWLGQA